MKNQSQADLLGVPVGSLVPILVPPGVDPQGAINDWSTNSLSNNPYNFMIASRQGGPNDFKNVSPIFDPYGNFQYGATGQASGQFISGMFTGMGDVLHFGSNNSINTGDIRSGANVVKSGGIIVTVPVHYP